MTGTIAELLLQAATPGGPGALPLTGRETSVLVRMTRGERPSEIATVLGIQPSTVSTRIKSIKGKLGASSTAELPQYAAREGLG